MKVILVEKYCKCGYKAVAYISNSNEADVAGFKRSVIITCPCCKKEIRI